MKKSGDRSQESELPFVFINMAMTADGKIATANRAVHSFGSPRDLEHLYELRATADAVMCGARTVAISQTILGNGGEKFRHRRVRRGLAAFPLRVVVSGSGTIDPEARLFQKQFSPVVVLTTRRAPAKKLRQLRAVAAEVKVFPGMEINFPAALRWLREKWNIRRLLCEGGGELNDALFRAGLVDELHLTVCPKIFGGRHAPTIADGEGVEKLTDAARLELKSARSIGDELFLVFRQQGRQHVKG